MEAKLVIDGATLECSLGSKTSKLKVPKSHGIMVQNKNVANISDYVEEKNILSFSKCSKEGICKPKITSKWIKGQQNCIIDGELALLDICVVLCTQGGIIKVVDSGQVEKED